MDTPPIAVLGAGSWGTALAIQLARSGRRVLLWGRDAEQLEACAAARRNERYLPAAEFPPSLEVECNLARAVATCGDLVVAVPSKAFRGLLTEIAGLLPGVGDRGLPRGGHRVSWATKGFELDSGLLPHQVAREVLGEGVPLAVLSGPTFAREVGAGLPTALTVAANDEAFANDLAQALSSHQFRAYTSQDLVGVEVGGAVKNALAIGTGIADGLGFGANTRIALITRGLAEMSRLGVKLGAQPATFMGLAALGDLVLTCTDNQSRNRRFGLLLAEGKTAAEAAAEIGQVVEGMRAASAVRRVARREGVEMPIIEVVDEILHHALPVQEAVRRLLGRGLKREVS